MSRLLRVAMATINVYTEGKRQLGYSVIAARSDINKEDVFSTNNSLKNIVKELLLFINNSNANTTCLQTN